LHGVYIGDAERIENEAGGGAAPHAEEDFSFFGKGYEVPNDEEIVSEIGFTYYIQLILHALYDFRGRLGEATPEPLTAKLAEVIIGCFALGRRYIREKRVSEFQLKVA
jgi:hypothetical protein